MSDRGERLSRLLEDALRKALRALPGNEAPWPPPWAMRLSELVSEAALRDEGRALARTLTDAVSTTAERVDQVSIAVTGAGWLGGGAPAVERVLSEIIADARREIMLTAFSVTAGSERVWTEIERAAATGIRTVVVVDRLGEQQEKARLLIKGLACSYPETFSLHEFVGDQDSAGLHAKVLVVDRSVALVGSANLTHRGMVSAHEMAVVVRGPTAERVAGRIDALVQSPQVTRLIGGSDAR